MATIDKQEGQVSGPTLRHCGRVADNGHHYIRQARVNNRGAKTRQRVHTPGALINKIWLVPFPSGLILFTAHVMVDSEHSTTGLSRSST